MSKPALTKINPGTAPIQTKTMFYTEGNPTGILVESKADQHTKRIMAFENAHACLIWCQSHGSNLFYTATNITAQ